MSSYMSKSALSNLSSDPANKVFLNGMKTNMTAILTDNTNHKKKVGNNER